MKTGHIIGLLGLAAIAGYTANHFISNLGKPKLKYIHATLSQNGEELTFEVNGTEITVIVGKENVSVNGAIGNVLWNVENAANKKNRYIVSAYDLKSNKGCAIFASGLDPIPATTSSTPINDLFNAAASMASNN